MPSGPKSSRSLLSRLGLVLFGILLSLILVEVGLRIAALCLRDIRGGVTGRQTILCVGDSHTYGLHVLPPLSYPARLQAILDPSAEEIGVLNYGVPGRNSGALHRELPRYLEQTHPDVVLVKIGYNDSWNFDAAPPVDETSRKAPGLFSNLRVVRLVRLLLLRSSGREAPRPPDLIERDGEMIVVENGKETKAAVGGAAFGLLEGEELRRQVSTSLEHIVATIRSSGATPVLVTYATENQPVFMELNDNARELAARLDVGLVDLAIPFREKLKTAAYRSLFFDDDHPNAAGNELVATLVADYLLQQGLVAPPANEQDAPAPVPVTLVIASRDAECVTFDITGAPERDYQIVLSPVADPHIEFLGREIPLGAHPLIQRCLESPNLRGRTGVSGTAQVRLGLGFLDDQRGQPIHAVAAIFPAALTRTHLPDVSARVTFVP